LEKLEVFGSKGDPRREQANQLYQYWKKIYFATGKYILLLDKYGIQPSVGLETIPATPLFSSPKAKIVSLLFRVIRFDRCCFCFSQSLFRIFNLS
jgi:hypothetical protein